MIPKMLEFSTQLPRQDHTERSSQQEISTSIKSDRLVVILCLLFKCFEHWSRYWVLFQYPGNSLLLILLLLGESASQATLLCLSEVRLSFEAVIFQRTLRLLDDPSEPTEMRQLAIKANRKSTSLPETGRIVLDLVDQYIIGVLAFSRSGYSWALACGASWTMLVLPWALQLKSQSLITQVSISRRNKENEK